MGVVERYRSRFNPPKSLPIRSDHAMTWDLVGIEWKMIAFRGQLNENTSEGGKYVSKTLFA
jgi:hypothetical protein